MIIDNAGTSTSIISSYTDGKTGNTVDELNIFGTNNRLVRYMCRECYTLSKTYRIFSSFDFKILSGQTDTGQDILTDIEDSEVPIFENLIAQCENCNKETMWVPIDAPIAEIISEFNKSGMKTSYSCSGHIKNDSVCVAYIMFSDAEFMEKVFAEIPEDDVFWSYWHRDNEFDNKEVYMLDQNIDTIDKFLNADHLKALEDIAPRLCEIAESLTS